MKKCLLCSKFHQLLYANLAFDHVPLLYILQGGAQYTTEIGEREVLENGRNNCRGCNLA